MDHSPESGTLERVVVREIETERGKEALTYGRLEGPSHQVPKCGFPQLSHKRLWIWGYVFTHEDMEAIEAVSDIEAKQITDRWRDWAEREVLGDLCGRPLKPPYAWSNMGIDRRDLARAMAPGIDPDWEPPPMPVEDDPIPF